MTRYIAIGTCVVDTHDTSRNPGGKIVCTAEPELSKKLATLLNEDEVITGILKMAETRTVDEFVDDVVRHTKVQS